METPTVAYITQEFPSLTETFVYREVLALRTMGLTVMTVANRRSDMSRLPDDIRALEQSTVYIFPIHIKIFVKILFNHLLLIVSKPKHYWQAIHILLSENSSDFGIWRRNIMHFMGAGYLARELSNRQINHLHAHFSNNAASLALFMSIFMQVPFSMTVHNNIFVDRLLLPAKLRFARFIPCISKYSRNMLLASFSDISDLQSKMMIVRCGINPASFQIEHHISKLHEPPMILCASQLADRKGIRYLIEGCALLKEQGIAFQCIIAGDGIERRQLESMVDAKMLGDDIQFIGAYRQDELLDLFYKSDVFVLPCIVTDDGDRDGIPVVLMEAMAAGLPVISTRVSGIPELIESGIDGLLVQERDPQALMSAIQSLFEDVDLRKRVVDSAQHKIQTEFNQNVASQCLFDLFCKDFG